MNYLIPIIASCISLLGTIILGLIAWGLHAEVAALRAHTSLQVAKPQGDIATLRANMETARAEVRAQIAEAINNFYRELNGTYIRRELYNTLVGKVEGLENRVNDIGD